MRDWRKTSSRRSIVQRNSSNSSSCSWHARRHRCKSARAGGSRPQTSAPRAARPVRRKGLVGCEAQNRDPPRSKWMPIKTGYVGQHSHTQGHRADRPIVRVSKKKRKRKRKIKKRNKERNKNQRKMADSHTLANPNNGILASLEQMKGKRKKKRKKKKGNSNSNLILFFFLFFIKNNSK